MVVVGVESVLVVERRVGSSPCRRVGDGAEGEDGSDNDCQRPGAVGADQRVAELVVRLTQTGTENQVRAVNAAHGGLCQSGVWVVLLHSRRDGKACDGQREY